MRVNITAFALACFVVLTASSTFTQTPGHPGLQAVPPKLWPSLSERINDFTASQANGDWERVKALLGDFRGRSYGLRYTNEHKQCLIEQMQANTLVSFKPTGVGYSSEIVGRPWSEKWFSIRGDADTVRDGKTVKSTETITAYRYQGNWFLSPPNYDRESELAKITAADLAADQSDHLKIEIAADCPVEMISSSVRIDDEYRAYRRLTFVLRNKSKKEIDGIGFNIGKVGGPASLLVGMPFSIAPGGTTSSPDNISYVAYGYYCAGEFYHWFTIDMVTFTDGSRWDLKGKKTREHARR